MAVFCHCIPTKCIVNKQFAITATIVFPDEVEFTRDGTVNFPKPTIHTPLQISTEFLSIHLLGGAALHNRLTVVV